MAGKWLQRLRAFESEFDAFLNRQGESANSAKNLMQIFQTYEYSGDRNSDVMRTFLIAEAIFQAGEDFRTSAKEMNNLIALWSDLRQNEIQSDDHMSCMDAIEYLCASIQSWMDLRFADAAAQMKAAFATKKALPESWKARLSLINARLALRMGRLDVAFPILNDLTACENITLAIKARLTIAEHLQLAGDSAACANVLSDEFFQTHATQDQLLRAEWLVLATDLQESLRIRDIASEVQQKGRHRNFQTNLEGLLLQFSKRLSAEIPLLSPESARKTLRNKNESERVDSQEFYNFVLSAYSSKKSHKKSHDVIAEVLRLELAQNKLLDHYQYRLAGLVVQALSQHETVRSQLNSLSESSAKLAVVSAALAPKDTTSTNKPLQRKILSRELFVSTFALRASATLLKIRLKKLVDRDVDLDADITTSLAELVASYAGMMRGPFMKLAQMANFFGFSLPSATRERLHDLFDNSRFVSADRARSIVETELGRPIDDVFQTWIDRPIACASVAQVHKAQLRTGEWVAVKIQHPDFDAMLRSDMRMIKSILPLMRWLFPNSDASAHFQKNFESLEIESDFHHEAEMMRKFRAHFAQDADVHVPKVFDELTSRKILVMEFVEGTSFRQYAESASMEDRAQSIRTIHKFIGKTTFEMGLINPDLHPGNFIFRTDGKVSFIDLGMSAVIDVERAKLYRSLLNAALSGDDSSTKRALFQLGFADDKNAEILSKAVHAAFIQDEHGLLLANDDTIKAIQNLFGRSTYSQLKSPLPASDFLVPRALFTFMNTVRELMGSTSPGKSKSSVKALAG